MILSPAEIEELTGGKVRPSAQARELEHMGVPFTRRQDGSLVVAVAAVERVLCPGDTIRPKPRLRLLNGSEA